MRLVTLYFLIFALCAPQISGAIAVASVNAEEYGEHAHESMEVTPEQNTKHGDCGGDPKQSTVAAEHSCCEDENSSKTITQCCDTHCDGCTADCGSSSLALISTIISPDMLASSEPASLSIKLPDPPNRNVLIPPII